uniref:Mediator of RNA polymerase II transcription subunit 31 n=1 Tax=Hippocampus comes TaxID=109280 RepID=A0A3Q2YWU2_HIPCM
MRNVTDGLMKSIEEQARTRFQSELEFIQCLANPNYLNFLAQRGFLRERPFINYLKYLLYWKEPDYAKFLKVSWFQSVVVGLWERLLMRFWLVSSYGWRFGSILL